jgi:DNA mismatch repair protein MutS2
VNIYPPSLLQEIEFDFVRQRVSTFAVTTSARDRLLALLPFAHFREAKHALTEVNELLALYETGGSVPALSAAEVDAVLLRLKMRNAILEPEACMQIKELVDSFNRLHGFCFGQKELLPTVIRHLEGTLPNKAIPEEIDRVFDIRGEIKSTASEELKRIRFEIGKKRAAADRLFYKVAKRYEAAGILGQIQETVHEDRRVLAVNASYKAQAKGILHGRSAKHSLLFVEPQETIEINNEITLLLDDERIEIQRILKLLTQFIAGFREELIQFTEIIRAIDFIHAKARFAYLEGACLPNISPKPGTDLIDAINPVLRFFNKSKQKNVVPLSATLDENQRILVISGPNAGGKSITLKTVGLLQCMLQSGLLVPVNPRSTIGWFGSLLGDIGDAQSIENELSTYSSKLAKMKTFLETADAQSLILIDEFGSGSDPDLGSALAQVFLQQLNAVGAFGVLTTHYNSIKALAGSLEGVINGSMQFNSQTFTPEYSLNIGAPGSSYTFDVAQRVGIPKYIISKARQKLDQRTVAVDKLLVAVQTEKNQLTEARLTLQSRLQELSALKDKQTGKIAQLEAKLAKLLQQTESQAESLMWGKRFESLVNSYLKERSAKNKKEILDRFIKMLGERAGAVKKQQQKKQRKLSTEQAEKLEAQLAEPIALGDKVKLLVTKQRGTVEEIRKDKFLIALGDGRISTWVEREKFVKWG